MRRRVVTGRARRRRVRRPPWWLVLATVVGVIVVVVLLQQRSAAPLDVRVADLPAAVAALEARTGGPQRYTEVNATPDGVNLFVAQPGDQQEQAWFFSGGKLGEPSAPAAVEAPVFALQGVDLTIAPKIARATADQFPGARITRFALVRQQNQVMWSVRALSSKGGTIEAFFTPDGKPLGGALK